MAPIQVPFFHCSRKTGLRESAQHQKGSHRALNQYDDKDAIGRRYRRQDAIGTPYCITVDHQTLEDETVTIRDRDSMEQQRIPVSQLGVALADTDLLSLVEKYNERLSKSKF